MPLFPPGCFEVSQRIKPQDSRPRLMLRPSPNVRMVERSRPGADSFSDLWLDQMDERLGAVEDPLGSRKTERQNVSRD